MPNFRCVLSLPKGVCNNGSKRHTNFASCAFARELQWDTATQVGYFHSVLEECARDSTVIVGEACHGKIVRIGLQPCILTSNMLLNMYSKCGSVGCARRLFDEMPEKSCVSWNTMIASYTQNSDVDGSFGVFRLMRKEGLAFNVFTISTVLHVCAKKCSILECKQVHALALRAGISSNVYVGTALLDTYAKCKLIKGASDLFDKMPERSDVTWSSMVAGYVQNQCYGDALCLFQRAQALGLEHNKFTFSSALCACGALAASNEGSRMHAIMHKTGFGSDVVVASSMIDMLSRCGVIKEAYAVFSNIEEHNVVSWNVMIVSFSRHACFMEAMILFEKMQQMGVYPNEVTYLSVLSACSHLGLVAKGRRYFMLMTIEHNISPNVVHYSCLVDIFSRAGFLHEAMETICKMPYRATASMWRSLLASCRIHRNLDFAKIAADNLFEIEPHDVGNHVLLSSIYAANMKWSEVATTRMLLNESEGKKERGSSWVEGRGQCS